jgi:hypothetical protein
MSVRQEAGAKIAVRTGTLQASLFSLFSLFLNILKLTSYLEPSLEPLVSFSHRFFLWRGAGFVFHAFTVEDLQKKQSFGWSITSEKLK